MRQYEENTVGNPYREQFQEGIAGLIERQRKVAAQERIEFAKKIASDRDTYRQKFRQMLGWPLTEAHPANIAVRRTPVNLNWEYDITRMEFEIFPDLWMYGILFKHRDTVIGQNGKAFHDGGKRPFILSQHGGLGTPELCSGLFGNTSNYNRMTERLLSLGANVFAPQLLNWSMGSDASSVRDRIGAVRHGFDNDLKQLGGSITALEHYGIEVILDYFEKEPYIDPEKIAMSGLSYGGFHTLFAAACDTRIKRALSCSQFNDRFAYNWLDWTWYNAGRTFTDAEIALLVFPRQLTLCVGDADELFDVDKAHQEYNRLLGYLPEDNRDWVDFVFYHGGHEYIKDDNVLRKALFDGWM